MAFFHYDSFNIAPQSNFQVDDKSGVTSAYSCIGVNLENMVPFVNWIWILHAEVT